jgi:hypothetical protein
MDQSSRFEATESHLSLLLSRVRATIRYRRSRIFGPDSLFHRKISLLPQDPIPCFSAGRRGSGGGHNTQKMRGKMAIVTANPPIGTPMNWWRFPCYRREQGISRESGSPMTTSTATESVYCGDWLSGLRIFAEKRHSSCRFESRERQSARPSLCRTRLFSEGEFRGTECFLTNSSGKAQVRQTRGPNERELRWASTAA